MQENPIPETTEQPQQPPPRSITEKDELHLQWYADAKLQTLETLPEFLRHLSEDYRHDYGTVCHMVAAGAVATCWAMNHSPQGGITGFQAGAIMWMFMEKWNGVKFPSRLQRFEDMLYPQYTDKFDKVMSMDTWEWVRKQAHELLEKNPDNVNENVLAHWRGIALDGIPPFGYRVEDKS